MEKEGTGQPLKIAFVFFPGGAAAAVVARPQVLITSFQFWTFLKNPSLFFVYFSPFSPDASSRSQVLIKSFQFWMFFKNFRTLLVNSNPDSKYIIWTT